MVQNTIVLRLWQGACEPFGSEVANRHIWLHFLMPGGAAESHIVPIGSKAVMIHAWVDQETLVERKCFRKRYRFSGGAVLRTPACKIWKRQQESISLGCIRNLRVKKRSSWRASNTIFLSAIEVF